MEGVGAAARDQAQAAGAGRHGRARQPGERDVQHVDLQIAKESLEALGFKVRVGEHMLERHGYLAGEDKARADGHQQGVRRQVRRRRPRDPRRLGQRAAAALSGLRRIRRNPKVLHRLQRHHRAATWRFTRRPDSSRSTDRSAWDDGIPTRSTTTSACSSTASWSRIPTSGDLRERNSLTQVEFRTQTITPGKARGRLLGGNLTVLTAILGSPYLPDWDDAILFCEDVHEELYRIDRMLTQLKLAGVLGKIKGFVFGGCSECGPGDGNYGALTLEEIFTDHIKPLGVPAWQGAMIGHAQPQWTLPEGAQVEIDADGGDDQAARNAGRRDGRQRRHIDRRHREHRRRPSSMRSTTGMSAGTRSRRRCSRSRDAGCRRG